jgi:hypothetical protein
MAEHTSTLLSGEKLTFPLPDGPLADFVARVRVAANDPAVSINELLDLLYSADNPLLDTTILPGRALATRATLHNPVYHVLLDLLDQKRIQAGQLNLAAAHARYTVDVPQAARRLGITPASVRAAIQARRLAGVYQNGQWWVSEESLASYKVSNRGRRKRKGVTRVSPPEPATDAL